LSGGFCTHLRTGTPACSARATQPAVPREGHPSMKNAQAISTPDSTISRLRTGPAERPRPAQSAKKTSMVTSGINSTARRANRRSAPRHPPWMIVMGRPAAKATTAEMASRTAATESKSRDPVTKTRTGTEDMVTFLKGEFPPFEEWVVNSVTTATPTPVRGAGRSLAVTALVTSLGPLPNLR